MGHLSVNDEKATFRRGSGAGRSAARRSKRAGVVVTQSDRLDTLAAWLESPTTPTANSQPGTASWSQLQRASLETGMAGIVLDQAHQARMEVPASFALALRARASSVETVNLRMLRELARVLGTANRANLPVLLLKGAALNLTLYDGLGLRAMGDLDLMVAPEHAEAACHLLDECGYRREFDLIRSDFFPRYHYEAAYVAEVPWPVRIDLHVRPFRPLRMARVVPRDAFWQGARRVRCGDAEVLAPNPESMLIHLAVHAAFHGFSRMAWLYDIKALLDRHGADLDWPAVLRNSSAWGLAFPLRRALELVSRLFGSVREPSVSGRLGGVHPTWADRLVLWQAPRDASSPLAHVTINWLTTPGWRFPTAYLLAHVLPDGAHLGGVYPYRHRGWRACAHVWRIARGMFRMLRRPVQAILGRHAVSGIVQPPGPQASACAASRFFGRQRLPETARAEAGDSGV